MFTKKRDARDRLRPLGVTARILVVAVVSILSAVLTPAAPPDPTFRIDSWDTSTGLPVETVFALAQTPDGFLWVGTAAGLARFDGVRFDVFTKSNTPALGNNVIQSLAAGSTGDLWIGTAGAGIVRRQNGAFQSFSTKEGLPGDLVLSIKLDKKGDVWAGTNKGPAVYRGGKWKAVGVDRGVTWPVYTLDIAADGVVWAGGPGGLARIEGDLATPVGQTELKEKSVTNLFSDRGGRLWIATAEGRLYALVDGVPQLQADVPGREGATGSSPAFQAILNDSKGRFWLGSLGGGLIGTPGLPSREVLALDRWPAKWVYALMEDRAGNVWVGTGTGLFRLRANTVGVLGDKEGLRGSKVRAVYEDPTGTVWVGSEAGLFRRREEGVGGASGRLEAVPGYPASAGDVVSLLSTGSDLLVGTVRGGLYRLRGGRFEPGPAGVAGTFVAALFRDRAGRLFVGTGGKGVHIFEGDREVAAGLPGANVRQFVEDSNGIVWAATFGGVSRLENGTWTTFTTKDGLASDLVMSVWRDDADRIWAGTVGGLSVLDRGRFHTFRENQGMAESPVYSVLEDANHVFRMGTGQGILQAARADLLKAVENASMRVPTQVFDRDAGMVSAQCSGGTSNVAWALRDGSMLFGTADGAVWMPATVSASAVVPIPIVQAALVDGVSVPLDGLRLAPGTRTLEVRYTAPDLTSPNKLRFRYRLEGFDPDWIDVGGRRAAIYTNLPAGSYRFRVQAVTENGVEGIAPEVVGVVAVPYFYRTWWFLLVCVVSVAAAIWLTYAYRIRQLELRHAAVLTERTRIAKDLHDTLLRGFTGVTMQLMAVSRTFQRFPEDAKTRLDGAIGLASTTLTEARHAIWDMRPPALESRPLVEALRVGCGQACSTEVKLDFSIEGTPRQLAEKAEVTLLRAAQESVANAVRHGQSTEIKVLLGFESGRVKLSVRDNGLGFVVPEDFSITAGHWGLLGMKQRVESLGGSFVVDSRTGAGTKVDLAIPA